MIEIRKPCTTPSKVLEIWKADDFFEIPDLIGAAETALSSRLVQSALFLRFNAKQAADKPRKKTPCHPVLTEYGGCGHLVRERMPRPQHRGADWISWPFALVCFGNTPTETFIRKSPCENSR